MQDRRENSVEPPQAFDTTLGDVLYPHRLEVADGGLETGLLTRIAGSYDFTLDRAGPVPAAVLWRSRRAQVMRFRRLMQVFAGDRWGPLLGRDPVTLADMGCGYGALFGWLRWHPCLWRGRYVGYDLSPRMVAAAEARYGRDPRARFEVSAAPGVDADYYLASGLFGLKLETEDAVWEAWVRSMLREMARRSRRGMAFNMLDGRGKDRRPTLYYAEPDAYLAYCREELGGRVQLIEDGAGIDFTILVRWD